MKYQVRVSESDDQILSVKLSEYSELQQAAVISDQSPGILRTWRGLAGVVMAVIGWAFFAYLVVCVGVRIFN